MVAKTKARKMMGLINRIKNLSRKQAIREGSIVLLDQGALSIATFVAGILVARACTQEEYGLYVLGWSVLLILQGFHKALVGVPFTVYAPRLSKEECASYQGSTLIHTLMIGILIALAIIAAWQWAPLASLSKLANLKDLLPLLAGIMIPFLTRDFMRNAMLARLEVSASVLVNLLATAFLILAMVMLFVRGDLTLAWSFHLYSLTSAVATLYMLWAYRTRTKIFLNRIWPDLAKGWSIGKWIILNTLCYMVMVQSIPWLILYFEDAHSVAAFGACMGVAGLLTPLLRGLTAYILPRMAHTYKSGDHKQLTRMLRISTLVLAIPYGIWLIAGSLFSEELITLFYSNLYSGYGPLMVLILGKTFFDSVAAPLINALQTLERTEITTASLAAGAVVTLVFGAILIQKLGLIGAGYAAVLSSAVAAGWKWVAIKNILRRQSSSGLA